MGKEEAVTIPETNEGRAELFRSLASSWTDPFRSLAMSATSDDEAKGLELKEWVPPEDLRSKGRAVLMGDSLHTMTMCKFTKSFFQWMYAIALAFLFSFHFRLFFFGPVYRFFGTIENPLSVPSTRWLVSDLLVAPLPLRWGVHIAQ